jgi:putative transposase
MVGGFRFAQSTLRAAPMSSYRRLYAPGGTYAFTVNLQERGSWLLVDRIAELRSAFKYVKARRPFETVAICVLPDHLHCLWTLPEGDHDFSTRWRLIKSAFCRALPTSDDPSPRRRGGRERGVWQRRYWEHLIRDERDFDAHLGYIHGNPVRHGYVLNPDDWPYSTWRRYKEAYGRATFSTELARAVGERP